MHSFKLDQPISINYLMKYVKTSLFGLFLFRVYSRLLEISRALILEDHSSPLESYFCYGNAFLGWVIWSTFSAKIAYRGVGHDIVKMTYMSNGLPLELLIWLIGDLKEMHYHKKNWSGGVNESAQIPTQTIGFYLCYLWTPGKNAPHIFIGLSKNRKLISDEIYVNLEALPYQFGFILFNPKSGGKISRLSHCIDIHDWNLRSAPDWYLFSLLLRWECLRSEHSAILLV